MRMHILKSDEQGSVAERPNGPAGRKTIRNDIDRLYAISRKGLWGLLIFLAASFVAFSFREQGLTGIFTPGFRELLGPAPPIILVNIILGISTLSSLIVIGGRIYHGREPGNTWTHLSFRLFFYLLYFVVDSLADHFHAVFISGLVVLALQHYNIWSYTGRAIEMRMTVSDTLTVWQKRVSRK